MPAPEYGERRGDRELRGRLSESRETRQNADNDSKRTYAEREAKDDSKTDKKTDSDKAESASDRSSDQKQQE